MTYQPKPQKTPLTAFYDRGKEFIARAKQTTGTDPCVAISPGTDEWNSWATYFHRTCGSLPAAMRDVERGLLSTITVPAQWPEWFDANYQAPAFIPVRKSPWSLDRRSPGERAAAHARIVAEIAREPEPSPKDENGLWRYPPKGVRIVGRFDKTPSHPGDDAA